MQGFAKPLTSNAVAGIIEKYLEPRKNFIYGFADLRNLTGNTPASFNYAISIGKKLDNSIISLLSRGPTIEYLNHYRKINTELSLLSSAISHELNLYGISTRLIDPTVSSELLDTTYSKTLRTPFSHKLAATRAGLGWIGKSDLLITREFGPRLRLVTILTETPLKIRKNPIEKSHCGLCNICVNKCPAGAMNGKLWDITVDRDSFYNPHKCRKMCEALGRKLDSSNSKICGICVAVCPVGKII